MEMTKKRVEAAARFAERGSINMGNITFTTEQKERIKQNVLAIEHYIVENVVPRLTSDIRIEFGGIHHCPRTGTPTPMHVLVIKKDIYPFCAGWNETQEAFVALETKFGRGCVLTTCYINDLYDLLQNWSLLKVELERAVKEQDAANAFINNFEV